MARFNCSREAGNYYWTYIDCSYIQKTQSQQRGALTRLLRKAYSAGRKHERLGQGGPINGKDNTRAGI